MKKVNMIVDVAKCHDCWNCFLACKDEHWDNDHLPVAVAAPRFGHRWIDVLNVERGQYPLQDVCYLPHPCMHCDEPACMKADDGAVYKRDDGIVIIDPEKAKGKKELVGSCPYHAIFWNEEKQVAQKCTMCAHLLDDGWSQPRCVHSCPTGAMLFLYAEDAEMEKIKNEQQLECYQPEYGLKPRVYYKNLYRFTKCHVAGSVALPNDECAENAEVTLTHVATKKSAATRTNNFGDFKIDNLEPNSGKYKLRVRLPSGEEEVVDVELKASLNVGTISAWHEPQCEDK
jgi:Fe-S-cluster-containing dehydrogenase component